MDIVQDFQKNGIAIWKHKNLDQIEKAREIILSYKHTRISELLELDQVFSDILFDLKPILDSIFNEGYHLTTFSSNTLRKNDKEKANIKSIHVDYPYHDLFEPYPDEILGLQVNYACDDFTIENGATLYVPNSYKYHRFPNWREDTEILKTEVPILVEKGSIIMYRGDMWHRPGVNTTDNPRVAILANFSPLFIDSKDNMEEQLLRIDFPTLSLQDDKVVF